MSVSKPKPTPEQSRQAGYITNTTINRTMASNTPQADTIEDEEELELDTGDPVVLNTGSSTGLNNLGRGDGDSTWVPAKRVKIQLTNKFNNIIKIHAKRNTTMMFKTHGTQNSRNRNKQ